MPRFVVNVGVFFQDAVNEVKSVIEGITYVLAATVNRRRRWPGTAELLLHATSSLYLADCPLVLFSRAERSALESQKKILLEKKRSVRDESAKAVCGHLQQQ